MRFRLSGEAISPELIDLVVSLTDRSRLRYEEVTYDRKLRVVRLPITRFPLVKRRRVLPNSHDRRHPIPAVVTVRKVVSCDIEDNTPAGLGEVQLMFGVRLNGGRVYACSAEEERGRTCFSITLEVSELDVEIADLANGDWR